MGLNYYNVVNEELTQYVTVCHIQKIQSVIIYTFIYI